MGRAGSHEAVSPSTVDRNSSAGFTLGLGRPPASQQSRHRCDPAAKQHNRRWLRHSRVKLFSQNRVYGGGWMDVVPEKILALIGADGRTVEAGCRHVGNSILRRILFYPVQEGVGVEVSRTWRKTGYQGRVEFVGVERRRRIAIILRRQAQIGEPRYEDVRCTLSLK